MSLNYSMSQEEIISSAENKEKIYCKEIASIRDLKRGVYAKNNISKDSKLVENDIYFRYTCAKKPNFKQ